MSTRHEIGRCCERLGLDALAYGELAPEDELPVLSHLNLCRPCQQAHEALVAERRGFRARSRGVPPAPLPSFDLLLARAEREQLEAGTRWQAILRSWISPWRGAVLQAAVGMFAIGMLAQVAILGPSRPVETVRSRASAATTAGTPSLTLDPWGESIADDACAVEAFVCEQQALALDANGAAPPAKAPYSGAQAPASIDGLPQFSPALESTADAVCVPESI